MDTTDVGVININHSAGEENWERAFIAIAARADVFGVNESLTRAQRNAYKNHMGSLVLHSFGLASPNPVFWDSNKYEFYSGRVVQLHGPGPWARRWPGYNAARFATVVVLRHKKSGELFVFICTHWVPRGKKVPDWWRKWAREQARLRCARIVRAHVGKGRKVVLVGDLNVAGSYHIISGEKYIVAEGVDKIIAFPKRKVLRAKVERFDAPVDHGGGVSALVSWT